MNKNSVLSVGVCKSVWSLLLLIVTALAALSGCAERNREKPSVAHLSEEKIKQMDLVFFNEISLTHEESRRYGNNWREERMEEFQSMAARGYVPAQAFLRLQRNNFQKVVADKTAFDMLLAAANKGDVSSQCALYEAYRWSAKSISEAEIERYVIEPTLMGAQKNHFMCLRALAIWNSHGEFGREKDSKRAKEYWIEAARQGSHLAYTSQIGYEHLLGWTLDPIAMERSLCWAALAADLTPRRFGVVIGIAKFAAAGSDPRVTNPTSRQVFDDLVEKWTTNRKLGTPKAPTVAECIELESAGEDK